MRRSRPSLAVAAVGSLTALAVAAVPAVGSSGAVAAPTRTGAVAAAGESGTGPVKDPVAVGRGGAVSSVDPYATRIGLRVLADGGSAADAAVATAAALGVTEPYSSGIGGGGFFLHYDAQTGKVSTIDGRETAPRRITRDAFIDPDTGDPYPFFPDLVTSGVSVGVPGTPRLWGKALRRFGTLRLGQALRPAADLARDGFRVDATFNLQTEENAERFREIRSTRRVFLRDGEAPRVGTVFRNPDLARTYRTLGREGVRWLYNGRLGAQVARTVQDPPAVPGTDLPVPPGSMTRADLRDYDAPYRRATAVRYRGLDVYGMPPPSSGGSTIGESLNILEHVRVGRRAPAPSLHSYLESTALAYADRAAYLGDSDFVDVPLRGLLSEGFGRERACLIDPDEAAEKPVAAGEPDGSYGGCDPAGRGAAGPDHEGLSTTHLSVVDRTGDVVSYTLTIEQTGGSGIVVPRRGFLLNNELTDFSLEYVQGDPNRIQPGKRPRSSMAPTIVLRDGEPWLAVGSPGGSTIITTVLQVLLNRIDLGMNLAEAVEAPRASQRNTPTVTAEQEFIDVYGAVLQRRYGHEFAPAGEPGTSAADIGAVAAIELRRSGQLLAVAEPERRGGGDAGVVRPRRP